MADSLDSLLEVALTDSSVDSPQDSLVVAVHACLLSAGYALVATGDEVIEIILKDLIIFNLCLLDPSSCSPSHLIL